jgi:DNA-directed RNA polymerase subunit beta
LISSLSCFARINEYGFIESPYRKVENGRVIEYVKIYNGGDTGFKPKEHVPLEAVEAATQKLKDGQRAAEFEPEPFYLTAGKKINTLSVRQTSRLDENGYFVNERNAVRIKGEFTTAPREEIQYMDVSPKQLVSVAASLIPFLENDDANARNGSNMQRHRSASARRIAVCRNGNGKVPRAIRRGVMPNATGVDYVDRNALSSKPITELTARFRAK